MAASDDPLLELLRPRLPGGGAAPAADSAAAYVARLTSLPLATIRTGERAALATAAHTVDLALQGLAARNHGAVLAAAHGQRALAAAAAVLADGQRALQTALPAVDGALAAFAAAYGRDAAVLQQRARSRLLHAHSERLVDILQLPSLLQALIAAGSFAAALDALAHVRRLYALHARSAAVGAVHGACAALQAALAAQLVATLRGPLKLPVAMKTVGFLRRTLGPAADERAVRGVFLVCRLAFLRALLRALDPLRVLADESALHAERYLKRWLELFREQSFGIVSMYRSIFPGALSSPARGTATPQPAAAPPAAALPASSAAPPAAPPAATGSPRAATPQPAAARPGHSRSSSSLSSLLADEEPDGGPPPDPVVSFEQHLVAMLVDVLRAHLPRVAERGVRESLLTQVLYASGSLGRLGGEFAGVLAAVDGVFAGEDEFVAVVLRQKALAGRLEAMAAGRAG